MGILGKVFGATVGGAAGGPVGFFVGLGLGHGLDKEKRHLTEEDQQICSRCGNKNYECPRSCWDPHEEG